VVGNILTIADHRLIKIITHDDEVVGFLFAFHDVSAALQRARGSLNPFSLADILLAPHRSYLPVLSAALAHAEAPVKALAHITGGGLIENLPRILPPELNAQVFLDRWQTLPIFELIQSRGSVAQAEMYRVFNMGLGMLLIAAPESLALLQSLIPEKIYEVGELIPGEKKVVLR
jgi:phosphoribosylformylglycinamidine cyclo-ligase